VSAGLKVSCVELRPGGRGGAEWKGGRNRRLKHKVRGEKGRKGRDRQEPRERGQEVSKTVVISRLNTNPKERRTHTHTHTHIHKHKHTHLSVG